ncbi:MAG: DoxX family protein [Acidobacteriota bacterium]|nr:DoxX family protein [Acidobacteriota bacterium]
MKIAIIIVRTLIGLMFLFASVTYFLNLVPQPDLTGNVKTFMGGLTASGYIMPVAKTFEFLCGLAFVAGRFVTLAIVLIFPIALNILLINVFLMPSGLPIVIPLFLGILFLAYVHRENYKSLLVAK